MAPAPRTRPRYSTWIRASRIIVFWIASFVLLALGWALSLLAPPLLILAFLAVPFFYIAWILTLTAWRFSDRGGKFQDKIHATLIEALKPEGPALDIGCGSGRLIITIARQVPGNHVGLDFWGADWEYSKSQCQDNARLEGIRNVNFLQGSASRLPLDTGSMPFVTSCLTFHEVHDTDDKLVPVQEALRVLAPGGRFAFFDLFDDPFLFPDKEAMVRFIAAAGAETGRYELYRDMVDLPFPLDTPRALRHAVLITGRKLPGAVPGQSASGSV